MKGRAHTNINISRNVYREQATSPKTNLELDSVYAALSPNAMARSLVLEFMKAKTREWEAAEQRWQEQQQSREG